MRSSPHIGPSRTPFGKQRGAGQLATMRALANSNDLLTPKPRAPS
jgi:hypothetical protein